MILQRSLFHERAVDVDPIFPCGDQFKRRAVPTDSSMQRRDSVFVDNDIARRVPAERHGLCLRQFADFEVALRIANRNASGHGRRLVLGILKGGSDASATDGTLLADLGSLVGIIAGETLVRGLHGAEHVLRKRIRSRRRLQDRRSQLINWRNIAKCGISFRNNFGLFTATRTLHNLSHHAARDAVAFAAVLAKKADGHRKNSRSET